MGHVVGTIARGLVVQGPPCHHRDAGHLAAQAGAQLQGNVQEEGAQQGAYRERKQWWAERGSPLATETPKAASCRPTQEDRSPKVRGQKKIEDVQPPAPPVVVVVVVDVVVVVVVLQGVGSATP